MTDEELQRLLREWGDAHVGRLHDVARDPGPNPISRAREFAPMTRKKFAAQIIGRGGQARRRHMAEGVKDGSPSLQRMQMVPKDYVDPIPCTESRHRAPMTSVADMGIPKHLERVERAAIKLYRIDTLCGSCLRLEFCGFGSQSQKAAQVSIAIKSPVGLRMYREKLAKALGWMQSELSY